MIDLQGRVVEAEAPAQELLQVAPDLVTVGRGPDQDMGGQGGEAAGDEPDMHIMDPCGAASSRIWPVSRSRPQAARSMRPTTIREAIESARSKPVMMITIPAISVPAKAYRSVTMCAKAPLTLIESRLALAITQVAATFTATPTAATVTMMPPVTGTGWRRRLMASKATSALTTSNVMPLA